MAQPYGSTDVYLDGANLIDPGNAGTQVANINQDMTDSVKFLSASYGAEYAKGPAVLQAFQKAAARSSTAKDIFMPAIPPSDMPMTGSTKQTAAIRVYRSSFYYIGGNIGGPSSSRISTTTATSCSSGLAMNTWTSIPTTRRRK